MPSRVLLTMASSEDWTMAARCARALSASRSWVTSRTNQRLWISLPASQWELAAIRTWRTEPSPRRSAVAWLRRVFAREQPPQRLRGIIRVDDEIPRSTGRRTARRRNPTARGAAPFTQKTVPSGPTLSRPSSAFSRKSLSSRSRSASARSTTMRRCTSHSSDPSACPSSPAPASSAPSARSRRCHSLQSPFGRRLPGFRRLARRRATRAARIARQSSRSRAKEAAQIRRSAPRRRCVPAAPAPCAG